MRLVEGCLIDEFLRVEDGHIRCESGFQVSTRQRINGLLLLLRRGFRADSFYVGETEDVSWQPRRAANCEFEREDLFLERIEADLA